MERTKILMAALGLAFAFLSSGCGERSLENEMGEVQLPQATQSWSVSARAVWVGGPTSKNRFYVGSKSKIEEDNVPSEILITWEQISAEGPTRILFELPHDFSLSALFGWLRELHQQSGKTFPTGFLCGESSRSYQGEFLPPLFYFREEDLPNNLTRTFAELEIGKSHLLFNGDRLTTVSSLHEKLLTHLEVALLTEEVACLKLKRSAEKDLQFLIELFDSRHLELRDLHVLVAD